MTCWRTSAAGKALWKPEASHGVCAGRLCLPSLYAYLGIIS